MRTRLATIMILTTMMLSSGAVHAQFESAPNPPPIPKRSVCRTFAEDSHRAVCEGAYQGDARSLAQMALYYEFGDGVEANPTLAFAFHDRAAQKGSLAGGLGIADFAARGLLQPPNWVTAGAYWRGVESLLRQGEKGDLDLYVPYAEQGHARAEHLYGYALHNGVFTGGAPDPAGAYRWFLMAAEQGNPAGQTAVGQQLLHGRGVAQDQEAGRVWLERAAANGYAEAQAELGFVHSTGQGVPVNWTAAFAWYHLAANQGHRTAQNQVGWAYKKGLGVTRDTSVAAAWFRRAAAQGSPVAQNNLGVLLELGDGVPQNVGEAAAWYRKSAEQGYAFGQYDYATVLESGRGVERNVEAAVDWYRKAAAQGDKPARDRLAALGR
jgi:TPR repeat protein